MTDSTPGPVQDPAVRARVAELHAAGKGRNQIAAELGLSNSTITRIAKALGLDFNRDQTKVAVAARSVTLRERRQKITVDLYDTVDELLSRLRAREFQTLVKGEGGSEYPDQLDFVPTPAVKDLVTAVGSAVTSATRLEQVDAGSGVEKVVSMVAQVADALGVSDA